METLLLKRRIQLEDFLIRAQSPLVISAMTIGWMDPVVTNFPRDSVGLFEDESIENVSCNAIPTTKATARSSPILTESLRFAKDDVSART
jgi:hypothetical protein